MRMKIGDKVVCCPETLGGNYLGEDRQMHSGRTRTGKISYIHPKARFVTVAIEGLGGIVKESFRPWEVTKIKEKKRRR